MTEPEPDQWVLLECDDGGYACCLVRSDSVRYKDISTLGWQEQDGLWMCPECIKAFEEED